MYYVRWEGVFHLFFKHFGANARHNFSLLSFKLSSFSMLRAFPQFCYSDLQVPPDQWPIGPVDKINKGVWRPRAVAGQYQLGNSWDYSRLQTVSKSKYYLASSQHHPDRADLLHRPKEKQHYEQRIFGKKKIASR